MSTAPTGWQTPKMDWTTSNPIWNTDLNRIEGNIEAIDLGDRTVDDSQVPASDTGTLRELLDWLTNRLKASTEKTNWFDTPTKSIEAILTEAVTFSGIKTFGGGFEIERRTDDPGAPDAGRLWVRTDL